jgi:hypothetical protein
VFIRKKRKFSELLAEKKDKKELKKENKNKFRTK